MTRLASLLALTLAGLAALAVSNVSSASAASPSTGTASPKQASVPRLEAASVMSHAPQLSTRTRSSRALAATSGGALSTGCTAWYQTTRYAYAWSWINHWEYRCRYEDDAFSPGSVYSDVKYYVWNNNVAEYYGTMYEHVTLANMALIVDYCYWLGKGQTVYLYSSVCQ